MNEQPSIIPEGYIKRIHVDQARIKANAKHGTDLPALTVQANGGPYKAHEVIVNGPGKFVYAGEQLSCGARCWFETESEIETIVR